MISTRERALEALQEIWLNGRKPKDAIEDISGGIDDRERSFLMELVYGVLRFRDTIDWALKGFLKKPSGLNFATLNNIRLAAYQILFMRVPEWAAVNEAVEMEKKKGRPQVVNAVLRSLLRKPEAERLNLGAINSRNRIQRIAVSTSHPEWLIRRWVRRFGEDEALELAKADNVVPPLTLRVNALRATREDVIEKLARMGIDGQPTHYSPDGIRLKEFRQFKELSGLKDIVIVQDEASQLISYLLDPQPGERILDACSAPGGKTTHMAQLMRESGEIVSIDNDRARLKKLRENVSNLGLKSIKIVQADVLDLDKTTPIAAAGDLSFDRILVDAPCSSIGVIRKNPDIKYRHRPDDLKDFGKRQKTMLLSAAGLLKPGGVLVYSVCSTEPDEGEEVLKEFLKDSAEFYIIDDITLPFLREFMKEGIFRTFPHKNDMDGFFGVRLCKRA